MCAIIDANSVAEVFGARRSPAGRVLAHWLSHGGGRLAVGGKLHDEMKNAGEGFRRWARQAVVAGRMRVCSDAEVSSRTAALAKSGLPGSDDLHILALAQASGARILVSRDEELRRDFKNKALISGPRGKVYSSPEHRHLLDDVDLCRFREGVRVPDR